MRASMKRLIEEMGGTVLMDGALIQFGEESFERFFSHLYEAGMDKAATICYEYSKFKQSEDARNCAALIYDYIEHPDNLSDSSGVSNGTH